MQIKHHKTHYQQNCCDDNELYIKVAINANLDIATQTQCVKKRVVHLFTDNSIEFVKSLEKKKLR